MRFSDDYELWWQTIALRFHENRKNEIVKIFTRTNSSQKNNNARLKNYQSMNFYGEQKMRKREKRDPQSVEKGQYRPSGLTNKRRLYSSFFPLPKTENWEQGRDRHFEKKNFWGRNMRFLLCGKKKLGERGSASLNRHCSLHEVAIMLRWNAMTRDLHILRHWRQKKNERRSRLTLTQGIEAVTDQDHQSPSSS